jgi:Flp pilus assembly protein TadG
MVLPLMFTILLGIFWFGRAYNVYATIARAAQEGAAVAATSTCGSCASANQPASTAQIASAVTTALQASKLDPREISSNPISSTAQCPNYAHDTQNNIDIYRNVQLNAGSSGPAQCGVIVTFRYPYQFYLPFTSLNMQRINMTAAAERQMEN